MRRKRKNSFFSIKVLFYRCYSLNSGLFLCINQYLSYYNVSVESVSFGTMKLKMEEKTMMINLTRAFLINNLFSFSICQNQNHFSIPTRSRLIINLQIFFSTFTFSESIIILDVSVKNNVHDLFVNLQILKILLSQAKKTSRGKIN